MRYITETKNLFDYTKVNGLEHTSTGNLYSNYLKINGESFGVMLGQYDKGVNFIPHFILDAGTYTISLIAKGTSPGNQGQFGIIKFNSDGTKSPFTKQWVTSDSRQSYTFTLDENSEIAIRVQGYGDASNAKNLDSTFTNIQLELGDTATPYVPYGYFPMRRMKYKSNNVCQLLDKNKYTPSKTQLGITWTNNGDGTITANGTCTDEYYSAYTVEDKLKNKMLIGHKYFVTIGSTDGKIGHVIMFYPKSDGTLFSAWGFGWVLPEGSYSSYSKLEVRVNSGKTVDNITFKPQLFDLTEMYGAGHEPTTVEQFRQDFPDEMYDYSPYCWASMKNIRYLDKTKNLFDINKAVKVSGGSSLSIDGKYLTVSDHSGNTHISANILLDTSLVGKTVTFSAYAKTSDKNTAYLRIQWLNSNGLASTALIMSNNVSGQTYQKVTLTGVVPEQPGDEFNMLCLSFYSNGNKVILPSQLYTVIYTDIQLELGDTATPYVPYGYLPLK